MRTTLTLDEDVAVLVERERRRTQRSLKEVVNDALRAELERRSAPPPRRKRFVTKAILGRPLLPSYDSVAEVLAYGEGEDYR